MRHHTGRLGMLVLPLMVAGCMRGQTNTSTLQTSMTAVSVRFMMPTDWTPAEDMEGNTDATLASVNPSDGSAMPEGFEHPTGAEGVPHHVALWGGTFNGNDMTHGVASLTPGSYTFAYVDREHDAFMQGWLDVNGRGFDLLDVLYGWQESIPQQKHQLAFDLDLRGAPNSADGEVFNQFATQLQAYDRLERSIDQTIQSELRARTSRTNGWNHFLSGAEVLIMPGGEPVFQATTRPAISRAELASLNEGDSLTKIVLVADYDEAQWKMRRVDSLYNELSRTYTLFGEVADRLERRKGLFLMTDHLYNNDKKFVRNERWLQQTVGAMQQLDQQMSDLRDRRVALAFISELIAPGTQAGALVREQDRLFRERTQFQTEKRQIDTLFADSSPESPMRISLERSRQRLKESLASIDRQLDDLNEARETVASMAESTEILHRQGDTRMLAATFVGETLPFKLRMAVQRESLMTVRVQASQNVFVPTVRGMQAGGTVSYEVGQAQCCKTVTEVMPDEEEQVLTVTETDSSDDTSTNTMMVSGPPEDSYVPTEQTTFDDDGNPCMESYDDMTGYGEMTEPTASAQDSFTSNGPTTPVVTASFGGSNQTTQSQDDNVATSNDCPLLVKLLVPPCWLHGLINGDKTADNTSGSSSQLAAYKNTATSTPATQVEDNATNDECPPLIKLLVPPCWLHGLINGNKAAKNSAGTSSQLAAYKGSTSSTPSADNQTTATNDDCPLLLKILVPPCWLHGLINGQDSDDSTANNNGANR